MERPLNARAVVVAERADVIDHVLDVFLGHLAIQQDLLAAFAETCFGRAAKVHHDLDQVTLGGQSAQPIGDLGRNCHEQGLQIVGLIGRDPGQHAGVGGLHGGIVGHIGHQCSAIIASPRRRAPARRRARPFPS